MKIGIIGMGVVGQAVGFGALAAGCEIFTHDKYNAARSQKTDQLGETELCFICVPTPTGVDGQDLTEVEDTIAHLKGLGYKGVVVMKSTVEPGTMHMLASNHPELRFVHNPEFLNERSAEEDFLNQANVLLSGSTPDVEVVARFHRRLPCVVKIETSTRYAVTEYAKYVHNCVLAVKLSFLNEVYDLIGNQSTYDRAVEMAATQGNLGSHYRVPGPDGKRGWGGMCFPKDMLALEAYAIEQGHAVPTISGAIQTNTYHRPVEMTVGYKRKKE